MDVCNPKMNCNNCNTATKQPDVPPITQNIQERLQTYSVMMANV